MQIKQTHFKKRQLPFILALLCLPNQPLLLFKKVHNHLLYILNKGFALLPRGQDAAPPIPNSSLHTRYRRITQTARGAVHPSTKERKKKSRSRNLHNIIVTRFSLSQGEQQHNGITSSLSDLYRTTSSPARVCIYAVVNDLFQFRLELRRERLRRTFKSADKRASFFYVTRVPTCIRNG